MQIGYIEGIKLLGDGMKLVSEIWRSHVVESAVSSKAYTNAVARPKLRNRFGDFSRELESLFNILAVLIGLMIRFGLQKRVDQVTIAVRFKAKHYTVCTAYWLSAIASMASQGSVSSTCSNPSVTKNATVFFLPLPVESRCGAVG